MATLQIKKKSDKIWEHIDSELGTFIVSKFYFNADFGQFQIVEQGQSKRRRYDVANIEVFDIGGSAETFVNITQLSLRLEELSYVGFSYEVLNVIGVEEAPEDGNTYGRKDAEWVEVSSEVLTTNTNITSSLLTTQDVAGFVTYINALNPVITVAANEIRTYTVTDTGQKYVIMLRGRSFGFSEPAILVSDIFDTGYEFWNNINFNNFFWESRGDATITVLGAVPPVVTGTAGVALGGTTFYSLIRQKTGITSSAASGSSAGYRDGSFQPFNFRLGFDQHFVFSNSDAVTVTDGRTFVGCTTNNVAIANVNPSSLTSCFAMADDSTDTNFFIIHNDDSGTCTKINLGANFPSKTTKTDVYYVRFWSYANSNKLNYYVERLNTGDSATGTITTDLNTGANGYAPHFNRNNGATAAACNITFVHFKAKTSL